MSSSCGLIEKFKTPEEPTDSKSSEVDTTAKSEDGTDDLFAKTMNDVKEEPLNAKADAPSNIASESDELKEDFKSLEDEFSGAPKKEEPVKEIAQVEPKLEELKQVKVEESLPEIKPEIPEEIIADNSNPNAGKVMSYKVHKGETLMQIAFKIYGDVSKWKEIKNLNKDKLTSNSALNKNMELKYVAPSKEFVWNPEGTPYMIKNGETLGTISNSVYKTPKKWKSIWENNKPLIKNPNVIYAGFTLYYKSNRLANYVQPKAVQKKLAEETTEPSLEEVKVEQAITKLEQTESSKEIDLTNEVQSAPIRNFNEEITEDVNAELKKDELQDQAISN